MNMESSTTKNGKPVQSFRLRGVSASVFQNKSQDGKSPYYKVSLQRAYKQGDDWKSTTSLSRDDLPIAALLLQKAWESILKAEAGEESEDSEE